MTITTLTIGNVDYTSYASLAEADEYLAVDPVRSATWIAQVTDDIRKSLLVSATRRMDMLTWLGDKTGGSTQENAWGRTGVLYKDGTAVPDNIVPLDVANATILLAGSIAIDSSSSESGSSGSNTKLLKAGSAKIEYFRPEDGKPLQDESAYALIKCFIVGAPIGNVGNFASGTDQASSFCDPNAPGLTRGYS